MKKLFIGLILLLITQNVWAADTKTTALTENTAPAGEDLIYSVDDPGGTPASRKVTITNLFGNTLISSLSDVNSATTTSANLLIGNGTSFDSVDIAGTGVVVDIEGEFGIDTTDDQWVYYGGAKRVLPYERTFCVTIENLAAADDNFPIWSPPDNITLVKAVCHCTLGTCTTEADLTLETLQIGGVTVDDVGGTIDCEDTTAGDSATTLTADNTVDALDVIRFDVDNAVSPETDTYTLCVTYTTDSQ